MWEIQRYDGQRQWTEGYQLKKNKWIKWEKSKNFFWEWAHQVRELQSSKLLIWERKWDRKS